MFEAKKQSLLTGDSNQLEFGINKSCSTNVDSHKSIQNTGKPAKKLSCIALSWKCMCLSTLLTTTLLTVIMSIVLFVVIFPNVAQHTLDNATMQITDGTIYPTNSSIIMNSTIQVSNVGIFSASIPSTTVTVYNENILFGSMKMPSIKTIANTPSIITVVTTLIIKNKTQFQKSCRQLLQNKAQTWTISVSNIKLTVHTGFIGSFKFTVNLNKGLILPGAYTHDFVASEFNVNAATPSNVSTVSNLDFVVDGVFKIIVPPTTLEAFINGTYIGYAPLHNGINMIPGHNILLNQTLIVESNASNKIQQAVIGQFFSKYLMNHNQNVTLIGPVSRVEHKSLVIDGVLNVTATALGYSLGRLAFGAVITSESQRGWTGPDVRGAYANMLNPYDVPLRIHNMSADTFARMYLKYDVTLLFELTYHCSNTSELAHLYIGAGIVQNNASITWVDIAANSWASFFTIAAPFAGSKEIRNSCSADGCLGMMPFSCCFATMQTAYICALNPRLTEGSRNELTNAFMPLKLYLNMTAEIDHPNGFMVNLTYNQPFFPVFFGYEVYAGYLGDAYLDCGSFTYYSDINKYK